MKRIPAAQVYTVTIVTLCLMFLVTIGHCATAVNYRDRYRQDMQTILSSRLSMQSTLDFVDAHPEIYPGATVEGNKQPLNREQRMIARQSWQNFLDHILFFDTMGHMYGEIYDSAQGREEKEDPFFAAVTCFLAQYRFAMDYIGRMEKNPDMHTILNEAVPELGLEEGTYARVKYRFLNVIRGAEFARLNALYRYYKKKGGSVLQSAIEEDIAGIWESGKGKGPVLTVQNGLKIVGDLGFTAWFPVQKNLSQLMGTIKVWRPGIALISLAQIEQLQERLRPGDILLQRREWYATNIGIPGFWTHAALYIGTPEERTQYFTDPDLVKWFVEQGSQDGTLDKLLQNKYPNRHQLSVTPQEDKHRPRVLEAIGEGVSFTTLEHSAAADSLVVLRPNLPQRSVSQAIIKAFHYGGRPYDFNFDFRTDSQLVCSELVYKAYEATEDFEGLSLPLSEVMERPLLSPNEIARIFDQEYGRETQQFTFVAFLDGNEKEQKAVESDVEHFRASWKRPKWHIWMQEPQENGNKTSLNFMKTDFYED